MVCTIFSDKHEVNSIYKNDYEKHIQGIRKKLRKRYGKCIVKVMIHFKSIVNTAFLYGQQK